MADFGFRRVPAREKAGYVRRHFNSVVGMYDFMNTLLSLGIHHLWKRAAVRSLRLKPGERVIDVCGGTADLSLLAAGAVGPSGRVLLTDINRAMIMAGQTKVEKATLAGRILAVQGDAESLPFPANSFDAAVVGFGIRNLTCMERGMAEMHRVLRPGGKDGLPGVLAPRLPLVRPRLPFLLLPDHALGGEMAGWQPRRLPAPPGIDPAISSARTDRRPVRGNRIFRGGIPEAYDGNRGDLYGDKTVKLNRMERWAVNNPLRPLQQRLEIRWLARRCGLTPGGRVLEVGCGRGAGSKLIKETFRPAVIHALDLDIEMIRRTHTYLAPDMREGIAFCVGDGIRLPYRDGTMDAVFGFGVLHHIPDWQRALDEIVRVLAAGGIYCFEELYPSLYQNALTRRFLLHPAENRFRSGDLRRALKCAGLAPGASLENRWLGIIGFATKR